MKQAFFVYEAEEFEPSVNISTYLNVLLTCLFYSPIMPHAIPFACIGTFWTYWIWKIMFLRENARPREFSPDMALFWGELMPFITVGWALSYLFFTEQILTKVLGD